MVTVAGQRGWFPIPAAGAVGGVTGGLLMVRVCGMLSSRVCGLLGSVCGSVGLAVLVVALAALATRHAYAEDPIENCVCPPDMSPEECALLCGTTAPPPPCSSGHPDCAPYVTPEDCFPGPLHENNCAGDPRCNCRWKPNAQGQWRCYCLWTRR
jgi:hypothetical protein